MYVRNILASVKFVRIICGMHRIWTLGALSAVVNTGDHIMSQCQRELTEVRKWQTSSIQAMFDF